jgi:hypothetical protein
VRLTPAGASRVDAAMADLLVRERQLLAGLDAPQQEALADVLRRISRGLDEG